ncbi:dual specificity protein phosphatase family protein SCDLUD_002787 [Saccharomycodes ludwigii]|uniref:dual specificity protein phosphatase family protein n=1 Tax=Saccharomycodes ludwigii TaxID=36035 RepID=UPI001E8571ED|nr:hypothetical protein SCDLUD_002787 [Saccharomycodes ludwigii]KAH3901296.1 hypothetical protein SCDLUD_002787 [Saccharomycodes ludwigii]
MKNDFTNFPMNNTLKSQEDLDADDQIPMTPIQPNMPINNKLLMLSPQNLKKNTKNLSLSINDVSTSNRISTKDTSTITNTSSIQSNNYKGVAPFSPKLFKTNSDAQIFTLQNVQSTQLINENNGTTITPNNFKPILKRGHSLFARPPSSPININGNISPTFLSINTTFDKKNQNSTNNISGSSKNTEKIPSIRGHTRTRSKTTSETINATINNKPSSGNTYSSISNKNLSQTNFINKAQTAFKEKNQYHLEGVQTYNEEDEDEDDLQGAYPNGPVLVVPPNIYLYSEPSIEESTKFDVIINVAKELTDSAGRQRSFKTFSTDNYYHYLWTHDTKIIEDLPSLTELMYEKAVLNNSKILVHCQCGVSRSASLIVAYIMRYQTKKLKEAYNLLKLEVTNISPNMGLIFQLMEWQDILIENDYFNSNQTNTILKKNADHNNEEEYIMDDDAGDNFYVIEVEDKNDDKGKRIHSELDYDDHSSNSSTTSGDTLAMDVTKNSCYYNHKIETSTNKYYDSNNIYNIKNKDNNDYSILGSGTPTSPRNLSAIEP